MGEVNKPITVSLYFGFFRLFQFGQFFDFFFEFIKDKQIQKS